MNVTRRDEVVVEDVVGTYSDGTPRRSQQATVNVSVGGVVRTVLVERWSPDHCWTLLNAPVIVRFPTGTKEHRIGGAGLVRRGDSFAVAVHGFRNCNRCRVVRWATDNDKGSGW